MNYTPLHVHSDASADGAGTVQSLVAEAKKLGMTSLALTDHGTLANAVAFWSACQDAQIKPILGMEAYLSYKGARHHLTLLSLSEKGFNNLIALDSLSHSTGWNDGYPTMSLDDLHRQREDIMALTGCISSPLYKGTEVEGLQFVGDLINSMEMGNVAAEMMFIGTHNAWDRPMKAIDHFNLYPVVTNDSHYPCQNQFKAHQCITTARRGFTYDSSELWLKSYEQITHEADKWVSPTKVRVGLSNTNHLAARVTPFSLKAPPTLPHIPNCEEKLSDALKAALKLDVALKGDQKTRVERLKYEFRTLKTKGFLDYIFILWDIVRFAKDNSIAVGPGRGSGGGSYVLYLLGITGIDPIEHHLLFERFINPSRSDYPDVDVDFEADRRGEVINYASATWNTVPIATYNCYSHKSAIHDIARVLKIPKTLEEPAADSPADSKEFDAFLHAHPDAHSAYQTMLGQIRHKGKHAAGVIIANRPVPIERAPSGELVAAWAEGMNTKDLSKVGIVKFDILGLTALSQLKMMEALTGAKPPDSLDDDRVFDLFGAGDVSGVFQWSGSDGIRELTQRIAPKNFYDLTTCNALYRPGALHAGTAEEYPTFMKTPRKLHSRIDPHLEMTYGVICYQEQVMAIVAECMSGNLAQADIARRLISKAAIGDPKWEAEIAKLKEDFLEGAARIALPRGLAEQLWDEIYMHSGYSYNLSHASAYTMISYWMAWYKVYHRPAFTVAVLQYDKANAQTYIIDAVEHGVEIRMPNINHSTQNYELVWSTILNQHIIHLPLNDVAFLGDKAMAAVIAERDTNGEFKSYEDFAARIPKKTCNNRAKTMLERIGAFDDLKGDPKAAIEKYEDIPVMGGYGNQLEILGYVVPKPKLMAALRTLQNKPAEKKGHTRFVGFIKKIEKKKSAHGEYFSFHLAPSGHFWCREPSDKLKVGAFVSGTKSQIGHSKDAKTYRLDSGV